MRISYYFVIALICCVMGASFAMFSDTARANDESNAGDPQVINAITASVEPNQACSNQEISNAYRLGTDDELSILVLGEKDLSGQYVVSETGTISVPLIGKVFVSGCTSEQVEDILHYKFADGYLANPSISIKISNFRPFYIIGEVQSPGKYDYAIDMNVLKAVAIAGGFTYRANKKEVKIIRASSGNSEYQIFPIGSEVLPGDIVFIKERFF